METQHTRITGCSKSISKKFMVINTYIKKNFKQPNFTPQELEKEEKYKPKVSRRKDITKKEYK